MGARGEVRGRTGRRCYAEDVVYEAPGGQRISGRADLEEKYFDALGKAAPDRLSRDIVLFADGENVVEQARYVGTHTGPLRSPDGVEVSPTGKQFAFPFVGIFRVQGGKIRSIRIFYDQIEFFSQLGLMPEAADHQSAASTTSRGRTSS